MCYAVNVAWLLFMYYRVTFNLSLCDFMIVSLFVLQLSVKIVLCLFR
jgi:hypothetical protein